MLLLIFYNHEGSGTALELAQPGTVQFTSAFLFHPFSFSFQNFQHIILPDTSWFKFCDEKLETGDNDDPPPSRATEGGRGVEVIVGGTKDQSSLLQRQQPSTASCWGKHKARNRNPEGK